MKGFIRMLSVFVDVLAIIALVIYTVVDNVAVDVTCSVVIIIACILEIVRLLVRRKSTSAKL